MIVALVTETYLPEINGVAMTLSQLVEGLRDRGHGVQVVRPLQRGEDGLLVQNGKEIIVYGIPIPNYPEVRFGLPSRSKLIDAWFRQRPDIVHVATEGPLGISAIRAAKALGIPCVSSFHTNFHSYSKHYGAAFMTPVVLGYLRWVHNRTRCTMAPTQVLVEELVESDFENMSLLGRGVKLDVFNPKRRDELLREQWGASPETTVVLHVSRLAVEKNYELLFESFRAIRESVEDCVFVVVGDGPLRNRLRKLYPNAVYTGGIGLDKREELARIYASSDLFLYPSVTETYGNVTTEAMACGLPVVAYDYAAAAMHVKSGYNGVLVPFEKGTAFVEASLALALDKPARLTLGKAAALTAKGFDWSPVIESFERTLQSYVEIA